MADVKRDKTNLQEHLDATVRAELVEHDDPLLLVGPQLDGEIQVCRSLNGLCVNMTEILFTDVLASSFFIISPRIRQS